MNGSCVGESENHPIMLGGFVPSNLGMGVYKAVGDNWVNLP